MAEASLRIQQFKRQKKTHLDLSGLGLIVIPQEVYSLEGLKELDLSSNKLSSADPRLGSLTSLQELILDSNNLRTLPQELSRLKGLTVLSVKGNPLSSSFTPLLNCPAASLMATLNACLKKHKDSEKDNLFDDEWDDPLPASKHKLSDDDFGFDSEHPSKNSKNPMAKNASDFLASQPKQPDRKRQEKDDFGFDGLLDSISLSKGNKSTVFTDDDDEIGIEEVSIGPKISQGGYSIVVKGSFRGTEVAVKKIFDPVITDKLREEMDTEIVMLTKLRHPHIVLMMGYSRKAPNLFIIFELLKRGSLFDILHRSKDKINDAQKLKICLQIAKSLQYIHMSKIVHRDVKSLNVLLDENMNAKLCDFGIAKKFGGNTSAGTPNYLSPEQFEQRSYDHKVDVFAFGTLLWETFTEQVPFDGLEAQDIKKALISGRELQMSSSIPQQIQSLIKTCRSITPADRPEFWKITEQLAKLQLA